MTTLRDIDGTVWYVRNGEVLRVGNSSQGYSVAAVDLPLSAIAPTSAGARALALAAADEDAAEPAVAARSSHRPSCWASTVTAEAVLLRLRATRAGDQWGFSGRSGAVKTAFDDAGVPAPTPSSASAAPRSRRSMMRLSAPD